MIKKIQQSETEKKQLEEVVKKLEVENKKLKKEIQELKKENNNSPEFQAYFSKKEKELQNNEVMLREIKTIIDKANKAQQNLKTSNFNNKFPTGWVIGGGLILVTTLFIIVALFKKSRLRKNKERTSF